MSLFSFFHFFSIYEGPFEKKVDRFLGQIKQKTKLDWEKLMQEDLVRLTIFLEYKFKGYKKLKRGYRKKLYANAHLIQQDFQDFFEHLNVSSGLVAGVSTELLHDERFLYLASIMAYLKPGEKLIYRESSNFEKLLRNPKVEKLVGDCNQIVTLYIYLYSLRYSVSDLQIKILPGHVCLHYRGVDIETTAGRLTGYEEYTFLSPVTEILAANLLDVSDPDEKQFSIHPHNVLQSAELALELSSHRPTVEKNLWTAYYNLAIFYAHKHQYEKAIFYANKSGDTQLQRTLNYDWGVYFLKEKKYEKAREQFRKVGDSHSEKACDQTELSDLLKKIEGFKTVDQYKKQKSNLKRIKILASKLQEQKVVDFVDGLFKKF